MKRFLIWLIALGSTLLVLVLATVLIVPRFIDKEKYLPILENKVTETTGRPFQVGDDVTISVFPWAGASFSNLHLGNPEKFGGGDFIKVQSFEARVKLLPLLTRKIEVDKFVLNGPEIYLVKLADGSVNWSFAKNKKATEKQAAEKQPSKEDGVLPIDSLDIGEFAITGGRLVYLDKATGMSRELTNIDLRLENISLEDVIGLDFSADYEGQPISLKGSFGPIGKVPGEGTIEIDIVAKLLEELEVALAGQIIEPIKEQKFNLKLKVAAFSPRKLLERLKIDLPMQPSDPAVLNTFKADLNIAGGATDIGVNNSTLMLDDSTMNIEARVRDLKKPDIFFKLDLDAINIDRYLPQTSQEKTASSEKAKDQPREPAKINYGPLRRLALDGEVRVGEMVARGAKVENILIKIMGKNGVFDLSSLKMDLYEGTVDMIGNFNVQRDQPVSNIDLKTENIKIGPLLRDFMKKDILRGKTDAAVKIGFSGDTAADIKKTLSGSGNIGFFDGAIVGIDIAELGRSLAAGAGVEKPSEKPTTDFAELSVPFTLTKGVFQTENSSLVSPLLRVKAFGAANLVSEKLDMKVQPKIVGTLKGQGDTEQRSGLLVPIIVQGTFTKPTFKPDVSAIASEETIIEAIKNPESLKEKGKSLEEAGKNILKGLGFGN